jgi:hypothetical protein
MADPNGPTVRRLPPGRSLSEPLKRTSPHRGDCGHGPGAVGSCTWQCRNSIPRLSRVRCSTQPSVGIHSPLLSSAFRPVESATVRLLSLRDAAVQL